MKKILIGIVKVLLITILVVVLTFGVWIYFRGTQPMEFEGARGINFWQFIQERWTAYKDVDARISALPQYLGCRNDIVRLFPVNLKGAFNFAYASSHPESKMAYAFKYWEEKQPDAVLPQVKPVNFVEIPDAFWSYFENAYWRGLVSIDYLAGECKLGPVNFDSILKVSAND